MKFTDQLRAAVNRDSRPITRVAEDAGLSPIQLFRFMRDERGLNTPAVDALVTELGLELGPAKERKRQHATSKQASP